MDIDVLIRRLRAKDTSLIKVTLSDEIINHLRFSELLIEIQTAPYFQTLELINCSFTYMSPEQFQTLCQTIQMAPHLQTLYIERCDLKSLNSVQFQMLCETIQKAAHIQSLILRNCKLDLLIPNQFQMLCAAIQTAPHLLKLDLRNSDLSFLSSAQFQEFCTAIQTAIQLQDLFLEHNGLGILHKIRFQIFCTAIQHALHLKTLGLGYSDLDSLDLERAQMLCTAIKKMPRLQALDLSNNALSLLAPNLFQMLCTAIQTRPYWETLDLRSNDLHALAPDLFQTLCTTIQMVPQLFALKLDCNRLVFLDAARTLMLCIALVQSPRLQTLSLKEIFNFKDPNNPKLFKLPNQFQLLCTAIQNMPYLQTLILEWNNLDFLDLNQFQLLCTAIQKMSYLQTLILGRTALDSEKLKILKVALENHPSLIEVKYGNDGFEDVLFKNHMKILARMEGALLNKDPLPNLLPFDIVKICNEYQFPTADVQYFHRYYSQKALDLAQTTIEVNSHGLINVNVATNLLSSLFATPESISHQALSLVQTTIKVDSHGLVNVHFTANQSPALFTNTSESLSLRLSFNKMMSSLLSRSFIYSLNKISSLASSILNVDTSWIIETIVDITHQRSYENLCQEEDWPPLPVDIEQLISRSESDLSLTAQELVAAMQLSLESYMEETRRTITLNESGSSSSSSSSSSFTPGYLAASAVSMTAACDPALASSSSSVSRAQSHQTLREDWLKMQENKTSLYKEERKGPKDNLNHVASSAVSSGNRRFRSR